jgi:hypothetical protein
MLCILLVVTLMLPMDRMQSVIDVIVGCWLHFALCTSNVRPCVSAFVSHKPLIHHVADCHLNAAYILANRWFERLNRVYFFNSAFGSLAADNSIHYRT